MEEESKLNLIGDYHLLLDLSILHVGRSMSKPKTSFWTIVEKLHARLS